MDLDGFGRILEDLGWIWPEFGLGRIILSACGRELHGDIKCTWTEAIWGTFAEVCKGYHKFEGQHDRGLAWPHLKVDGITYMIVASAASLLQPLAEGDL